LLIVIAYREFFDSVGRYTIDELHDLVRNAGEKKKEELFPLYNNIRSNQFSENILFNLITKHSDQRWIDETKLDFNNIDEQRNKKEIEHKIVIKHIIKKLINIKLINTVSNFQTCPLCEHEEKHTLTIERINEIMSWLPDTEEMTNNELKFKNQLEILTNDFETGFNICKNFLPDFPSDIDLNNNLRTASNETSIIIDSLYEIYTNIKNILTRIEL
jgi:hypothetical protein